MNAVNIVPESYSIYNKTPETGAYRASSESGSYSAILLAGDIVFIAEQWTTSKRHVTWYNSRSLHYMVHSSSSNKNEI